MRKTLEIEMETQIEEYLVKVHGYISRHFKDYDRELCLDSKLVLKFILATQPDKWEELKRQHGPNVKEKFLKRLYNEIERRGTLDVLRHGVKDYGVTFDLFYARPASKLNQTYRKLFMANLWSVTRQLHFSTKNNKSLDMVLFINGLPIITLELKDQLSGSGYTVKDAKKQYKLDRDPREPLFKFKRCLVHFAVDEDLVEMTTQLKGGKTTFLPFNKGSDEGAGNPTTGGFRTEYLWREIFAPELLSDILKDFSHVEKVVDENGRFTGEEKLIFPRYHQLDAVRKIIATAKLAGPGRNYLIQHSAGSGKSNTIAWLCHQLVSLHDAEDKIIFDSIIVITDRIVLDKQLQRTIQQFERTVGVVQRIDEGSKQLRESLEKGKKIIVTTIQKFPYIVDDINNLPGKNFALVVDEAHSSQSGETSKYLKMVLRPKNLDDAENEDKGLPTREDEILKQMEARGRLPNVSYFAFTATPKNKTFELFGDKQENGKYKAFHLYSMKQAIQEKFILDVLENYTTFQTYFHLKKTIEKDPRYDRKKATALLRSYVDLNPNSIRKKVEIIMDHFNDHVKRKIPDEYGNGQAKAMIVTRSRLHAVRYQIECQRYIKEMNYDFNTLVAFSGTVKDPDNGLEYTETGMNGFSDKQTANEFKKSNNKFLIVANKFQTGFDQPLLYAMYVDKPLSSIAAVQTLSRTNRIYHNKEEPLILDFANEAGKIEEAFQDYYDETILSEGTDPNTLYNLQHEIESYHLYDQVQLDEFSDLFFDHKVKQDKLHPILNQVVEEFKHLTLEEQQEFKKTLNNFVRLYSFLSQIVTFQDIELEKLYAFGRMLLRKLPATKIDKDIREIQKEIDLEALRLEMTFKGKINIGPGQSLHPASYNNSGGALDEKEALSIIINDINDRYGTEFTESDKLILNSLQNRIENSEALINSIKVNTKDKVKMTFGHVFDEELQDVIDEHFDFYKMVNDNKNIRNDLVARMFEMVYRKLGEV